IEIRDELRLQLVLPAIGVVPEGNDARNSAFGEFDGTLFAIEIGFGAGEDFDFLGLDVVVADGVIARFGVAAAPELGGNIGRGGRIPDAYGDGRSVNSRG